MRKGSFSFLILSTNQIKKQLPFTSKGDFEGIAKTDKSIFVLRSNGTLYELSDLESDEITVNIFETGVPSKDITKVCVTMRIVTGSS